MPPTKSWRPWQGLGPPRAKPGWIPGKPPVESTGTCEQRMIFDGRYLQQEYTGEMMGSPFTGINLIGYDNHAKKYVSTWIDSMSTGIYYFEGTATGKTTTQGSSYDDPVRGPTVWRSVTRIVDNNTLELEMFLTPRRGKEEKVMEMTVTRNQKRNESPVLQEEYD